LFADGCFAPVFLVLRFCNSQNCAGRSLTARRFAASAVAGRAPQAAFASFRKSVRCKFASSASVGAVLSSCRSPRSEFCEPPQGGASARTAKAGLYFCKPRPSRTSFPSTYPRCRQLHIPVCCGVCEQCTSNRHFKVLTLRPGPARAKSATPAAGPGEHLNEFPKGNDSMQRQHCHSEEIIDRRRICNLSPNRFLTALRLSFSSLRGIVRKRPLVRKGKDSSLRSE